MAEDIISKIAQTEKMFSKTFLTSLWLFAAAQLLTIVYYPKLSVTVSLIVLPVIGVNYGLYLGLRFSRKVMTNGGIKNVESL